MAKKEKCECPEGCPPWLTTFGDMMSLLLCFFIMLVSMASFEAQNIKEVIISLRGAFGMMRPADQQVTIKSPQQGKAAMKKVKKGKDDENLKEKAKIEEQLVRQHLQYSTSVELTKEGIILVILSPLFFEPGSDELQPEAYGPLATISGILNQYDNELRVEGHTSDSSPEEDWKYQDLWELSGKRAETILKYISTKEPKVSPERLSFAGYGQFHPKVSNLTRLGRSKNDRVEIKLLAAEEPADPSQFLRLQHQDIPDDTELLPMIDEATEEEPAPQ